MNDYQVEELLRSYRGPDPRPETKAAVMRAARGARADQAPAATVEPIVRAPRRRRRRWPALTAAAAAALLVAGGLYHHFSCPAGAALGRSLRSGLAVERAGRAVPVCKDGILCAGDMIRAPEGGLFELNDGSTVKMDRGTQLSLQEPGENTRARLKLNGGRLLLRVTPAPGDFTVSGTALVRVLGTVFGVEERRNRTAVSVLDGRVRMSSGGGHVELARGQSGAASASQVPTVTTANPDEELRWARERVAFRDRPLSEVLDWISDNSSYRFEITTVRSLERTVTVSVADQSMRELIEAVLDDCGLSYEVDGRRVKIK
jgi:ferric-dicitrate binding protein FerR (iron transport regulator)